MSIGIFNSEDQSLIKLASNSITADETIETLNDIKVSVATDKASVAADKATVSADKADIVSMKSEIANTKTTIDETAQTISENANSVKQEKIAIDETKTDIDKKYTEISNTASKLNTEYNNLTSNYYTKEATNSLISSTTKPKYSVVNELPTSDISTDIIYLKSTNTTSTDGIYEMYTYQDSNWVKIGTSNPDLADYYTKELADSTFATKTEINNTNTEISELKSDLDDYKDSISEYHKSVNLFDKSKITDGKILQGQNNEQTISSCFYTDYIPVEGGKTYCFQDNTGYLGQNGKVVCCYDANKTFLTSINQSEVIVRDGAVIFTINESKYVRVNGRTSKIDSFMFAEGDTLPSYEPYYEPYYEIKREVLPQMPLPSDAEHNPLYGKKLCVDGDSIMYGAGLSGGFAKIIGDNNSMTVVNNAVSGGTIASGTYHSDGTTVRHWICDTIKNIPSDADYILFDGGVNDSSETAEVGAISNGFSAELDTTTFCGAMESICKWLVINRPNAKIGYVIVHKMASNYTSEYPSDGNRDLYRLSIKICEKWGIPYKDLNTQVPPLKDIQSLRDVYTSNADGWHPNELGYNTYYVPKIEAWMKTL